MSTESNLRTILLCLIGSAATVVAGCQKLPETLRSFAPLDSATQSAVSPYDQDRRDWWEANKNKAEFVPGRGYKIAGVEGYFDKNGCPMDGGGVTPVVHERSLDDDEKDSSNYLLGDFAESMSPSNTIKKVKNAVGLGPNEKVARELMAEGQELFRKREYAKAAAKFEKADKRWPDTKLAEDALFMQAESLFFADDYPAASDAYAELAKEFPSTGHLDKAMTRQFAIGHYWQQMHDSNPHWPVTPNVTNGTKPHFDTLGHAIRAYENIRLSDPTGPLADDALMATATAYFTNGHYDDADYHFGLVRTEYPQSEHQFGAHLLGLQTKLRRYQGPDYDGTVLDEAEKLAEQLLRQFPTEMQDKANRQRVEEMRAQVAAEKALRLWNMAEFYANRNQYGSARMYWRDIIEKYPGTEMADKAQKQMTETQSEPAEPPERMKWLIDVFSTVEDPNEEEKSSSEAATAEEKTQQP